MTEQTPLPHLHDTRIILASGSPRRQELLERMGFTLESRPQDVDETPHTGETPQEMVARLAALKGNAAYASAGAEDVGKFVIAADTCVWFDDVVLGKPKDSDDACRMLRLLSGKAHYVSTGVWLCKLKEASTPAGATSLSSTRLVRSFVDTTTVHFYDLSDAEIEAYVATGEPLDKAGAYGYQALGCSLVHSIEGDYHNVVGLPIGHLLRELNKVMPLPEK